MSHLAVLKATADLKEPIEDPQFPEACCFLINPKDRCLSRKKISFFLIFFVLRAPAGLGALSSETALLFGHYSGTTERGRRARLLRGQDARAPS
jgi:hypothetical protein